MRYYNNRVSELILSPRDIDTLSYEELTKKLKSDLEFRPDHPGDHINNWDFERISTLAQKVGFQNIIESKYRGSVSLTMQGPEFDKTHPHMSLYVDLVK